MFNTRNDLPQAKRKKIVALLNDRLADGIDLQIQLKQAHWNVKGPSFIGLHELFDKIHEAVEAYVDKIAERAAQLGGTVEGTVRLAAKRSRLGEYPLKITSGKDHAKAVSNALATFGKAARHAVEPADKLDDADTADLFTEVSRGIDQWLWFVESHLQADQ